MKLSTKLIAVVLLFSALVLANYLAALMPWRLDATTDKVYTLSPGTYAILGKIEEPIILDFYWSKSASAPSVIYKNFAGRVEEMLRQYVHAAHGKIILNVIDPRPDTPEEEKATNAGIQLQAWPGGDEKVALGLVAIHADQEKAIPAFDPNRETFLEYDISQLIYEAQLTNKKRLGLITGLPLMGQEGNPMMMEQVSSEPQYIIQEWRKTFDAIPVDQSATELPGGLDALAVIHPLNTSPKLQFAIDQFLLGGKPVFLALDPSSTFFRRRNGGAEGSPAGTYSDLPVLLKAYGIDYNPQNIVGDLARGAQIRTDSGTVIRYAAWLSLDQENFNAKALPAAQLESIVLPEAGSFTVQPGAGLTVTPLLQSSPQSGDVPSVALGMTRPDNFARHVKPSGQKLLAAIITGKFKTAFPAGPPSAASSPLPPKADGAKDSPISTDKKSGEKPAPPSLKQSKTSSTLFFIADTDWLLDDFCVERFNLLGVPTARPLNDNLSFAANSLEFLSGSQDLISIRGKGSSLRPFSVVTRMENEAQKKYQQQLDALETHLNEVQQKLTVLQNRGGDTKGLLASPEVRKTIDDFQKQETDLQHQRRVIRLALREDIDALGNRLLLLNLLAMPVLVTAFGLWFSRHRRR